MTDRYNIYQVEKLEDLRSEMVTLEGDLRRVLEFIRDLSSKMRAEKALLQVEQHRAHEIGCRIGELKTLINKQVRKFEDD